MPKKYKQKQKQSQKTSVIVNVVTNKKNKSSRRASVPSASSARNKHPQSISVVLQGSSMNLPLPQTQDYNAIVQQLDNLRRQQAASGSLIPNMGRNDLLNRVEAHNPFTLRSTNTQKEMINPYESLEENQVESLTTSNNYDNNSYDAVIPIDQDFIRTARIKKYGQNFEGLTSKIGTVEDNETISDLTAYDDEDLEERLSTSINTSKADKGSSILDISSNEHLIPFKKAKAIEATEKLINNIGIMTPTSKEKFKPPLTDYESKRLEAIKLEKQREYQKRYREKKAGK